MIELIGRLFRNVALHTNDPNDPGPQILAFHNRMYEIEQRLEQIEGMLRRLDIERIEDTLRRVLALLEEKKK
jgi:hypothetical protein